MNVKKMITLLVGLIILLVSGCGLREAVSTPEPVTVENPTSIPTPALVDDLVSSVEPGNYVGLVYPPSPAELSKGFSMLIQDREGYGLSLVTDGRYKMLWLEKVARYGADGSVIWEVKDVLVLSDLEAGLTLIPDGCFLNGSPDSEIFVAGRNGVIVLAWRANTTSEKFEVVPVEGIKCNSDKAVDIT